MNGDFELNPVPAGGGCFVYQLASGWQLVEGYTVVVSSNCGAWGAGAAAPLGKYYLAVQKSGTLKQTVVVPSGLVGISLTLQFYMSKRLDEGSSSSVAVSVNGVALRTIALTSGFTRYSINTPAATSTMTIQFDDVSPVKGDQSYLMDNVTLSLAAPTSK